MRKFFGVVVLVLVLASACGGLADGDTVSCDRGVGWQSIHIHCWLDGAQKMSCDQPEIEPDSGQTGCFTDPGILMLDDGGIMFTGQCTWRTCKSSVMSDAQP